MAKTTVMLLLSATCNHENPVSHLAHTWLIPWLNTLCCLQPETTRSYQSSTYQTSKYQTDKILIITLNFPEHPASAVGSVITHVNLSGQTLSNNARANLLVVPDWLLNKTGYIPYHTHGSCQARLARNDPIKVNYLLPDDE